MEFVCRAFEHHSDFLILADLTGNVLALNRTAHVLLPHPEKESPKAHLTELLPAERGRKLIQRLQALLMPDESSRWLEADGPHWFEVRLQRLGSDQVALIALRNVTEHVRAEHAFRSSNNQLEMIFRKSPALMAITAHPTPLHGHYVAVNPALLQTLGYEPEEIIGHSVEELPLIAREKERSDLRKTFAEQTEVDDHLAQMRHKNGTLLTVIWTRIVYEQAGVRHILGMGIDVSSSATAQRQLRVVQKELESQKLAFRELLSHIETDKRRLKDEIALNVEQRVKPYLHTLAARHPTEKDTLTAIERGLNGLASDFQRRLIALQHNLTRAEIKVCQLVKSGFSEKEIAGILAISISTVKKHKHAVREKLGLKGVRTRLEQCLDTLE